MKSDKHFFHFYYKVFIRWFTQYFYDHVVTFGQFSADNGFWRWVNCIIHRIIGMRIRRVYEADTATIITRFPMISLPQNTNQIFSIHELEKIIQQRVQKSCLTISSDPKYYWKHCYGKTINDQISFSVVIPYRTHFQFFTENLNSLAKAISNIQSIPIEIIVINDDPDTMTDRIIENTPSIIRKYLRIITNRNQSGIARSLNQAIQVARYEWLVFVDCDDLLTGNSLKILSRRIQKFPFARYISSRMIDIDELSKTIRVRLRVQRMQDFSEKGMMAGHLKAIRRNLFWEIGFYDERFDGCQDYDFALRTILFEPILFIPDYLYRYRWHGRTQSVTNAIRQYRMTVLLQHIYRAALSFLDAKEKPPPIRVVFHGIDNHSWNDAFRYWGVVDQPLLFVDVQSDVVLTSVNQRLFVVELIKRFYEMGETFRDHYLSIRFPRIS